MKLSPNSPLWIYPGGATSDLLFRNRFETFLYRYEDHLVDEYIECQLHLNTSDMSDVYDRDSASWWLGSKQRIEMEVAFFEREYKITFDKVREVMMYLPKYQDMSAHSQTIYQSIMGHGDPD